MVTVVTFSPAVNLTECSSVGFEAVKATLNASFSSYSVSSNARTIMQCCAPIICPDVNVNVNGESIL